MAQTLFQLLSGEESPSAQRQKTKEESAARREYNKQEKVQKSRMHSLLDFLGLAPGVGAAPDLLSAYLYGQEGDLEKAGWSLGASVPGLGVGAYLGKTGGMMKYLNQLEWYEKGLVKLQETISQGAGKYDHIAEKVNKLYHKLNLYLGEASKAPTKARKGFKQQQKGAAKLREFDKSKVKLLETELEKLAIDGGDEVAEIVGTYQKRAKSGGRIAPAPTKAELDLKKQQRIDREYIDQDVYRTIGGQKVKVDPTIERQRRAMEHQRSGTIGEKYYDEPDDIAGEMTDQMEKLVHRLGVE